MPNYKGDPRAAVMSEREIAQALGLSRATVRYTLRHALEKVRKALDVPSQPTPEWIQNLFKS